MRRSDLGLIVLTACAVGYAGQRIYAWFEWPPRAATKTESIERQSIALEPIATPQLADWKRALFRQSIEKTDANNSVAEADADMVASISVPQLVGVIADGTRSVALFNFNSKIYRVHEGGDVGGWTVANIKRRTAEIRRGSQSRSLRLDPARRPDTMQN